MTEVLVTDCTVTPLLALYSTTVSLMVTEALAPAMRMVV